MLTPTIRRWFGRRFLPLSWLDYAALVAAAIGLVRECYRWWSA